MKFVLNVVPCPAEKVLLNLRLDIENISKIKHDLQDDLGYENLLFSISENVDHLIETIENCLGDSFNEIFRCAAGRALLSAETLQELIKNSIDAYIISPDIEDKLVIAIQITKELSNQVYIEFSDNGQGFPAMMLGEYGNRRYKKDLHERRSSLKIEGLRSAGSEKIVYLGGANLGLEWIAMVCQASPFGSLFLENIVCDDVIQGAKVTAISDLTPIDLNYSDLGHYESLFGCRFCVYEAILAKKLEGMLGERIHLTDIHEAYSVFISKGCDLSEIISWLETNYSSEKSKKADDSIEIKKPSGELHATILASPVTFYRETLQASNSVSNSVVSSVVPSPSLISADVSTISSCDAVIVQKPRLRIPPDLNLN